MEVYVRIHPADAVRAGKLVSGDVPVTITQEFLDGLTAEEREELAKAISHPNNQIGTGHVTADKGIVREPVTEPTLEAVKTILVARVEAAREIKAGEEEKAARHASLEAEAITALNGLSDQEIREKLLHYSSYSISRMFRYERHPWRSSAESEIDLPVNHPAVADYQARVRRIHDELEAEQEARAAKVRADREAALKAEEEAKVRFKAALAAWIEEHGTPGQVARQQAGVLAEEEALAAVRESIFAPLDGRASYVRMNRHDLPHNDDCYDNPDVNFQVDDKKTLSDAQFTVIGEGKALLPDALMEPRTHRGTCQGCNAVAERQSVRVTVNFHGRPLSREYALPDDEPLTKD